LNSLIRFVNENCNLNRNSDGTLNPLGRNFLGKFWACKGVAKTELPKRFYSVKENKVTHCDVIDEPTPEEFFEHYVLKSKPVIIRGGKANMYFSHVRRHEKLGGIDQVDEWILEGNI
jgi:hypothetical protein